MDIQTAIKYMQHGYRVRRPDWDGECYLYPEYNGRIGHKVRVLHPSPAPDTFDWDMWNPRIVDMVADDWEIITDGIVTDFPLIYSSD